jgi:hypothetical protein
MSNEGASPRTKGAIPRRLMLIGAAMVALATACSPEPRDTRTFGPYIVAIKADTPAVLATDEAQVFQVRRSVPLPLKERPPGIPRTPPYPGGVWYTPDQVRVQLSYVITNLEDKAISVELLVDGWNDFVAYTPQIRIVDDEVVKDRSCVQRAMILPPKSRTEGRVSFDDFERMAIALAAIVNKAPNPGHVLDPQTDLDTSPLAKPFIPAIISGITGFDLSLRSSEAARLAVEATVEIIDLAEVVMEEGNEGSSPNRRPRSLIPETVATP